MADATIGSLDPASSVGTSDLFVLEQNSTAKKLTGSTLVTYLLSMIDGHGGIASITVTDEGTSGNGQYHHISISFTDGSDPVTFDVRDGVKGDKGNNAYVHIKYANINPIADGDMGDDPDAWMGICTDDIQDAPSSYTAYDWYNIKGATGNGASLTGTSVLYQASTSGTTPTGTWQSTMPSLSPGQYLWTQISLTWNNGTPVTFMTVSYQGVNGDGSVNTVNDVSPDGNKNISLGASDIPYNDSTVAAELASLAAGAASAQSQINASGMLWGSGSGVVSAATLGTNYGAKSFTITLAANGWSSNAQTINNSNFVNSGYAYSIAPASSYIDDYVTSGVYADDISTNGQITFHCSAPPSGGIVVNVMRVVSA